MSRIGIATQRVLFLLDCTLLPAEDIQLNTRVFQWPKDMASVFDLAKTRTGHRRDQVKHAVAVTIITLNTQKVTISVSVLMFPWPKFAS